MTALVGVYEISKILSSPHRLDAILSGVLNLLSSFLDMEHGLIVVLDGNDEPKIVVGTGWEGGDIRLFYDALPEPVLGRIVTSKQPLVIADVSISPLFADGTVSGWGPADAGAYALIGVPIKDGDGVVGLLIIDRPLALKSGRAVDEDSHFLTLVANLVGQTLRLHGLVARDRDRLLAEQARREKIQAPVSHNLVEPAKVPGILGKSPLVQGVVDRIRVVAKGRTSVLLRGETGTGKELFANAIHSLSSRAHGPMIKLNCAALPESVLESELFGHEKGSFTGAQNQHKGRFELADGGTLFLDEIGEISPTFQAKLLRVLQEGEFERVGGHKPVKSDFRLICATNRNLEEMVSKGEFRADLYYRISVVPIFLPPLRDRSGDIPLLARAFLRRFNTEHGTKLTLSDAVLQVMNQCYFPGNIRELENCLHRTATLARGDCIEETDLACRNEGCLSSMLWRGLSPPAPVLPLTLAPVTPLAPPQPCDDPGHCPVSGAEKCSERDRLVKALELTGWVKAKAARVMGITPRQLGYAMRRYQIESRKF